MSSNTASNMVESLALAARSTTEMGGPPASPARCSLDPCLPRSTGFVPVRAPPFDRAQAEGVHTHVLQVNPSGCAQLVQQHRLELVEHTGLGPFVRPPPAGAGRPAAQLLGGQQRPGVEVRAMKISAAMQLRLGDTPGDTATRAGWGRW